LFGCLIFFRRIGNKPGLARLSVIETRHVSSRHAKEGLCVFWKMDGTWKMNGILKTNGITEGEWNLDDERIHGKWMESRWWTDSHRRMESSRV